MIACQEGVINFNGFSSHYLFPNFASVDVVFVKVQKDTIFGIESNFDEVRLIIIHFLSARSTSISRCQIE